MLIHLGYIFLKCKLEKKILISKKIPETIDGIGTVFVEVTEVGCVDIIVPPGIEVLAVTEVLAGGTEDAKPPKAGGFAALTAGAGLARRNETYE